MSIKCAAKNNFNDAASESTERTELRSVNDILRRHPRDRLFVPPLHWTSQHLSLLECCFHRKKAVVPDQCQQSQVSEFLRCSVAHLRNAYLARTSIIHDLLESYNLRRCSTSQLYLRVSQRSLASLETDGLFWPDSPASPASPRLAYLDLTTTRLRRNKPITVRKCERHNPPAARLRRKWQRRLQPADEHEDPYIAAVLMALAQAQHRDRAASTQTDCKVR